MQRDRIINKVKPYDYIWYLLLTPLLKTNGIMEHYSLLSKVNNALSLVSIMVLVCMFFKSRVEVKNLFLTLGFFSYIILRTISGHNDVHYRTEIISVIYCVGLILYILVLLDKPLVLIKAFLFNLELYIYINFFSLLAFPDGIYLTGSGAGSCWVLGYDNWWFIIFYVAYFFSILNYRISEEKVRTTVFITVIHISALSRMSGVLLLGVLVMDVCLITGIYRLKIVSFGNICLATVIANIMLIFSVSSDLVFFIVTLLQRPIATLLVRNQIWNKTMQEIAHQWLLGWGRFTPEYRINMYGLTAGVNAHNMWLEILFEGGLVGFIIFVSIVIVAGSGIKKAAENAMKELLIVCLFICFIGLSVDSALFELRGNLFFALFTLATNLCAFDKIGYIKPKSRFIRRNRMIPN